MKNWNEIEQRLKTENTAAAPAGLHDQIMRAVRDDRAAASQPPRSRHYLSYWLMGVAFGTALIAMIAIPFILPPIGVVEDPTVAAAPNLTLPNLEALATAPIHNEVEALRTDFASATRYLADLLPAGT